MSWACDMMDAGVTVVRVEGFDADGIREAGLTPFSSGRYAGLSLRGARCNRDVLDRLPSWHDDALTRIGAALYLNGER